MRLLKAAFWVAVLCPQYAAHAQNLGYLIEGRIIDAEFPSRPSFSSEPVVSYQVFEEEAPDPQELAMVSRAPQVKRDGTYYIFSDTTPAGLEIAAAHIFFDVRVEGYVLKHPETAVKEIPRYVDGLRTLPVEFELVRRSVLADASRREATEALDKPDPGPADFERAEISARKAIEIDPTLDNYLNFFDIIRKANRTDYSELMIDFHSTAALESLPGFDSLTFEEQWRLRRELLITLLRMPELDAPLGIGTSVREAAVSVGQDMVDELSADRSYRELPVVEVFRTLAVLHATNGDCPSLIENNARAVELSENAAMNWSSQRLFLLEWADCLLHRSKIGDGRSEEQFIADTAASPVLTEDWTRFETAAGAFEPNFAFPASETDARLLESYKRAKAISAMGKGQ
jgi:hypothetical protein